MNKVIVENCKVIASGREGFMVSSVTPQEMVFKDCRFFTTEADYQAYLKKLDEKLSAHKQTDYYKWGQRKVGK